MSSLGRLVASGIHIPGSQALARVLALSELFYSVEEVAFLVLGERGRSVPVAKGGCTSHEIVGINCRLLDQ